MAEARQVKERLREEVAKYLLVSGYLYVCFGALLLYKAALLGGSGAHVLLHGVAAAKALILGKFLLLGDAARIGERIVVHTLASRIAARVVLLTLLLVVLTLVEEVLVGRFHGRPVAATLAELGDRLPEAAASVLVLLLVLVPLVAAHEIGRRLGPKTLRALLLGARVPDERQ